MFGLTSQELEVLNALIEADQLVPCSRKARRIVADLMKFKTTIVVSNYIKILRTKGAIIQTVDGYKFNPLLILSKDCNSVEFQWTN